MSTSVHQDHEQQRQRNGFSGQDTLIVSRTSIVKRSSVITSVLTCSGEEVKAKEVVTEIADEEAYFKRAIQRELDENRYVLQKRITSGGMGAVYYVFDRDFLRYSAMKVILPELKHNSAMVTSFIREARITAQLEHPNIIPVHDVGFFPSHGIFFTMKMMQGERLVDILRRLEVGDPEYLRKYDFFRLLSIFRKVCDAVAFAHSKSILHRDIKPHNIMVGDYGEVLLMDWGLAKRWGPGGDIDLDLPGGKGSADQEANKTELGVIKGSPAYMSPEQASGEPNQLDQRSDLFLLGATLYHIFTFFPPYLGDDIYEIITEARNAQIMPPQELGTGRLRMPEELCQIIMKAMAPDKHDRYQTVEELAEDLDALLRGDMHFGHRLFNEGEYLMREGEIGTESYIIVSGQVAVQKAGSSDKPIQICLLEAGDIVGEMALITHEPRSASVVAQRPTEVMVLTQELFSRNIKRLPPWMGKTVVTLAERLGAANQAMSTRGGDE